MNNHPFILVLVGPFAVGKTTLGNRIITELGFKKIVTVTTRKPRPGERDGVDYIFKSPYEFGIMKEREEFIETAVVSENFYGTPKDQLLASVRKNERVVLTIDIQGLASIIAMNDSLLLDAMRTVYIESSLESSVKRALERSKMTDEELGRRVRQALFEKQMQAHFTFDTRLHNHDGSLDKTGDRLITIVSHWIKECESER